ncbi:hypothetical protein Hanom_Chr12g01072631 [Helianthus anomalus]
MVHYVLYLWMNILFFAGKLHWVLYLGMKEVEKAKNQKVLLFFFFFANNLHCVLINILCSSVF